MRRRSGMTLIELLVAMVLFLAIMALTFAAWNKAQHSVGRAIAILDIHYKGREIMDILETQLKMTSANAPLVLDNQPRWHFPDERYRVSSYHIMGYASAGYGMGRNTNVYGSDFADQFVWKDRADRKNLFSFEEPPTYWVDDDPDIDFVFVEAGTRTPDGEGGFTGYEAEGSAGTDFITVADASGRETVYVPEPIAVWGFGKYRPNQTSMFDHPSPPPLLLDEDYNIVNENFQEEFQGIDENGNHYGSVIGEVADSRGYPYDTYRPGVYGMPVVGVTYEAKGGFNMEGTDGIHLPNMYDDPPPESMHFHSLLGVTPIVVGWATNIFFDPSENAYRHLNAFENSNYDGDRGRHYKSIHNRAWGARKKMLDRQTVAPNRLRSDFSGSKSHPDDIAYIYRAINGGRQGVSDFEELPAPTTGSSQPEWVRDYGALVMDGEVQYVTTAPSLEFSMSHAIARRLGDPYDIIDGVGAADGSAYGRRRHLPHSLEAYGSWDRTRCSLTDEGRKGNLHFYRDFPACTGLEISAERKRVDGTDLIYNDAAVVAAITPENYKTLTGTSAVVVEPSDFKDLSVVHRENVPNTFPLTSPTGGEILQQPRWVRVTFGLVEDSNTPNQSGNQQRVQQTFDHWVLIR